YAVSWPALIFVEEARGNGGSRPGKNIAGVHDSGVASTPPRAFMLGNFACARYRFVLEAVTPLRLHSFASATLRGGFGHVFKRTVCLWPPGDCPRCLLKNTCSYPYIFETAPHATTILLPGSCPCS